MEGWMDGWMERGENYTDQVLNHVPDLHISFSLTVSLSLISYSLPHHHHPTHPPPRSPCSASQLGRMVPNRDLFITLFSLLFWVWNLVPLSGIVDHSALALSMCPPGAAWEPLPVQPLAPWSRAAPLPLRSPLTIRRGDL